MLVTLLNLPAKLNTLLARLTATRAGYLDNLTKLDANISAVSPIRSVQAFDGTWAAPDSSADITITAVTVAKTILVPAFGGADNWKIKLTSTTNVHADFSTAGSIFYSFYVVEFK